MMEKRICILWLESDYRYELHQKDSNDWRIWEASNAYLKINSSGALLPISSRSNLKQYSKSIPLCDVEVFRRALIFINGSCWSKSS